MLKKHYYSLYILIFITLLSLLTGCSSYFDQGKIDRVGLLIEGSINDQTWGNKGYKGLLQIKEEFDVDVYFKEEIKTQQDVNRAVEEFSNKGVNLIFGHSSTYGKMFNNISQSYPDIQFVYFNGGYYGDNLTSLNFNSHAMGFFGGMVAGEMTETNKVGIIASYEWQPEIEGFYEGVHYQNPEADVLMNFVNSWDDEERAHTLFEKMNSEGVDVFYPAGDAFSVSIIEKVKKNNKYAIGFVADQSDVAGDAVLTSTVQHVDQLYVNAAESFNEGELTGGVFTYDFKDGVITLGEFSELVPEEFEKEMNKLVEYYKETELLPNER